MGLAARIIRKVRQKRLDYPNGPIDPVDRCAACGMTISWDNYGGTLHDYSLCSGCVKPLKHLFVYVDRRRYGVGRHIWSELFEVRIW
jgi:hypothetical protein